MRRNLAMVALAMIAFAVVVTVRFTATGSAHAISVIDGDTVRVGGDRWRLTGFDTPETYNARLRRAERARNVIAAGSRRRDADARPSTGPGSLPPRRSSS